MSQHRPYLVLNALGLIAIAAIAGHLAQAGPLDPPAGPVAPTFKTLSEVEPRIAISAANTPGDADSLFKITQRGSYYLTGNITGVLGKHGIEIATSGVSIDLMGHDLQGSNSLTAIILSLANARNISIENGSIRGWSRGIDLLGFAIDNGRISRIIASGNQGEGITVGSNCILDRCVATNNTGNGIVTDDYCTLTDCSAAANGLAGISTDAGCTLTSCASGENTGNGFSLGSGCTATGCSSNSNSGDGFSATASCTITRCTARSNATDGIRAIGACTIRGCTAGGNGFLTGDGAGIHTTSADNRLEDNSCIGNDRGIDVDSSGTIILRNTCSGNTINWTIAANNVVLIVNATLHAAAISGNSGGTAPGSTDPNANFTY